MLGHVPVAGDGNCLFHALGYLDARGGAALRNSVAAFMVENAARQIGFEEAWLEEAEELLQGTWGGHTAITAYSLMQQVRVQIHTLQASGAVIVTDASHASVSENAAAPLRRILYSNNNHYDALVGLLQNPRGWIPAWPQTGAPIYYKEVNMAPMANPKPTGPPVGSGAMPGHGTGAGFTNPRPGTKKGKKGRGKQPAAKPLAQKASAPAASYPVFRRCTTKTTPPPELRDDILTELSRIPVKPRMQHPHQQQENFIKDKKSQSVLHRHAFRMFWALIFVKGNVRLHVSCCVFPVAIQLSARIWPRRNFASTLPCPRTTS